MKGWTITLIIIAVLVAISFAAIFDYNNRDSTDSQASCKETSETVSGYRLCLALEKCHDEFRDNSALRQDCLVDVFYQAYK